MNIEALIDKCKKLKLRAIADHLQQTIELAENRNWTALQTLDQLVELELELRRKNRIERCFKQSRLYEKTTIDQFDFAFHSSRKNQKSRILNLLDLGFIQQKKDVILIGNPGVGKSYLAKCMAYAATQAAIKVLFTTAMDMINHLIAAEADHSLLKKLYYYQSQELLAIDEIGYLSLGTQGPNLFFQVISARHERKSTFINRLCGAPHNRLVVMKVWKKQKPLSPNLFFWKSICPPKAASKNPAR
jgi:DNA replication protein DnaC